MDSERQFVPVKQLHRVLGAEHEVARPGNGTQVVAVLVGQRVAASDFQLGLVSLPTIKRVSSQLVKVQCPETLTLLIPNHTMSGAERSLEDGLR